MGEAHHIVISFRITCSNHSVDEITRIIGVEPTAHRVLRQKNTLQTVWSIEETEDQEQSIDTRICSLLAKVTRMREMWPEATSHWQKEIFCGILWKHGMRDFSSHQQHSDF